MSATETPTGTPTDELETYRSRARAWLSANAEPRPDGATAWGEGSDDVSIFHNLTHDEEWDLVQRNASWQRTKLAAGYGAISWPIELGGAGLPPAFERAFYEEEQAFELPASSEVVAVTTRLVAPTIRELGSDALRERFMRTFLGAEQLCCQLFSEPNAGSDLAGLQTKAERDGDLWRITGQKVWTSGGQFADWGELIARSDPTAERHAGMTAFLVPMDAPGVTVRPIRQMTGGRSFNEVFFDEVELPDELRLGGVGDGWRVANTTLSFERNSAWQSTGGSPERLVQLASWLGRTHDRVQRDRLARVLSAELVNEWTRTRLGRVAELDPSSAVASLSKLAWSKQLTAIGELAADLLGPRLIADTGEWGTYAWTAHLLGAPANRIAGGSDEVQRNIIGRQLLGLPSEPRTP